MLLSATGNLLFYCFFSLASYFSFVGIAAAAKQESTLCLLDKVGLFTIIRAGGSTDGTDRIAGDFSVWDDLLYSCDDESTAIGSSRGRCNTVNAAGSLACSYTLTINDDDNNNNNGRVHKIVIGGDAPNGFADDVLAIIGGTGEYSSAYGIVNASFGGTGNEFFKYDISITTPGPTEDDDGDDDDDEDEDNVCYLEDAEFITNVLFGMNYTDGRGNRPGDYRVWDDNLYSCDDETTVIGSSRGKCTWVNTQSERVCDYTVSIDSSNSKLVVTGDVISGFTDDYLAVAGGTGERSGYSGTVDTGLYLFFGSESSGDAFFEYNMTLRGQDATTGTVCFLEEGVSVTTVRAGGSEEDEDLVPGDYVVWEDNVYSCDDESTVIGSSRGICMWVNSEGTRNCMYTLTIGSDENKIVLSGDAPNGFADDVIGVVGGTGDFVGVAGSVAASFGGTGNAFWRYDITLLYPMDDDDVAPSPSTSPGMDMPTSSPVDMMVPTEAPVEVPASTEAPVDSPVEPSTEAPVESPVESPVKPPVEPPTEAPVESSSATSIRRLIAVFGSVIVVVFNILA